MNIIGGKGTEFNGNVRDFAGTGIIKMKLSQKEGSQKKIGDKFLATIEEKGSDKEKKITHFVRLAAKKAKSPQKIQMIALKALARETNAPVSNILAGIGTEAVRREGKTGKGKNIAKVFLEGVEKNAANPTEGAIARAVLKASSNLKPINIGWISYNNKMKYHNRTEIRVSALEAIEKGVGKDSIGVTLAKKGCDDMHNMLFINGKIIGKAYLERIRDASKNPVEKKLADAALNTTENILKINDENYCKVLKTALEIISLGVSESPEETIKEFEEKLNKLFSEDR